MVIGIKTYKASLKVTFRTSTGEAFDERVDIVLDADSREEVKARLEDLTEHLARVKQFCGD